MKITADMVKHVSDELGEYEDRARHMIEVVAPLVLEAAALGVDDLAPLSPSVISEIEGVDGEKREALIALIQTVYDRAIFDAAEAVSAMIKEA